MLPDADKALHLATHSGWYRFERNGEKNWQQADRALTFWQMSCIQVDPENPERVYIGTERSGMFVSDDGGKQWTRANPNVPCLAMSAMLALPGALLVGTMPAALYLRSNFGWQEIKGVRQGATGGTFPPNPDFPARTRVLSKEQKPDGRLFAGIEVGGILISDDGGGTWSSANEGLTDPDMHQILPSSKHDGLVVAACGEGVSRSTDRGSHWEKVTPAGKRTYGNALAEDVDGNVYLGITQDRPRTWTRSGRANTAIFKSQDGASWELLTENMQGGVMDMCTAPGGKGVLVGTADGEVVEVSQSGATGIIVDGLPCITALVLGA